MKSLFLLFWQICRLQRGPEDVPHSPPLLVLLIAALLSLSASMVMFFEPSLLMERLMGSVLGIAAWLALVFLLLKFKELDSRFVQTMTACVGTDIVISLMSLPFQVGVATFAVDSGLGTVSRLGLLTLMIWDILVKGRIYAGAMNLGRLQGNLLSICIWIIVLMISLWFMPEQLSQPDAVPATQQATQPEIQ